MAKKFANLKDPKTLKAARLETARQIHVNLGKGNTDSTNKQLAQTIATLFGRTPGTSEVVLYCKGHMGAEAIEGARQKLSQKSWAQQLDLDVFGNPEGRPKTRSVLLARARQAAQNNSATSSEVRPQLAPAQPAKRGRGRPRKAASATPSRPPAPAEDRQAQFKTAFGAPQEVPVIMSSWDGFKRELTLSLPISLGKSASFVLPGSRVPLIRFTSTNDGVEFVIGFSELSRPPIIRASVTESGIKFLIATIPGEASLPEERTEAREPQVEVPAAPLAPVLASEPGVPALNVEESSHANGSTEVRELQATAAG